MFEGGLDGVDEQVEQELLELADVAVDVGGVVLEQELDVDGAAGRGAREGARAAGAVARVEQLGALGASTGVPRACSGAMSLGVPGTFPVLVSLSSLAPG